MGTVASEGRAEWLIRTENNPESGCGLLLAAGPGAVFIACRLLVVVR